MPVVAKRAKRPLFVLVIGHVLILQFSLPVSPLMYNTLHTRIRSLFSHYVLFALFVSLSLFRQQHQCTCDKGFESLFNSQGGGGERLRETESEFKTLKILEVLNQI